MTGIRILLSIVAVPLLASVATVARADDMEWLEGGKLVLTNGVASVEGTSGGGLTSWAIIAGRETDHGIGVSSHLTIAELPDFGWQSHGVAVGIADRLEISYARQNLDTRAVGAALGLGRGYRLNQDVFAAKLRLFGDAVYGDPLLPQVSIGAQYKRSLDRPVVLAVGAAHDRGVDITVSATKLFLANSVLANATARMTKANQNGLLGFGSTVNDRYSLEVEASLGYQLSRRLVVGAEYRTKPDRLAFARENDWVDLFAAYAMTRNVTLTAAYVDLGSIATFDQQRGVLVSTQLAF